jgi:hypothetical protein
MEKTITVVVLRSLSYTGTTWINCLLGCHPRSFALGPADRVIKLLETDNQNADTACRVHAADCPFWPAFANQYDANENFYIQLSEQSGCDFIITNNPLGHTRATSDLKHPRILCRNINIVRDGRAICSSYIDKYPEKDFFQAVTEFFHPSAAMFHFDEQDPDTLCMRYEDVVADLPGMMQKLGGFIGLDYAETAHRFWEFDHHITAGNSALYGMIRRFQQDKPFSGKQAFYEEEYQRLLREPDKPIVDKRWEERLGRRERFIFDIHSGELNASWGYDRDTFTAGEFETFRCDYKLSPKQKLRQLIGHAETDENAAAADWRWKIRKLWHLARNGGIVPASLMRWALRRLALSWIFSTLLLMAVTALAMWLLIF